mmetsp:Transcript_15940/g.24272  ORF Transcript_15940/g.24272 Transcript_15940/m.24272 type:complete len:205 (+) Transcript_15940:567-1181(+)
MTTPNMNVGILIFDNVEVLDFTGPFEVFSRTRLVPGPASRSNDDSAPFTVFTVAKKSSSIRATGGLEVVPSYDFTSTPMIDLLVVPGGFGTRPLLEDEETLHWIQKIARTSSQVVSVCTGAFLLAKVGLLKNKKATTHWGGFEKLKQIDPSIEVDENARFVEDGIITAAGISAGIDVALFVVEKIHGKEVADETAQYMVYERRE